jgi:hypothetical protein
MGITRIFQTLGELLPPEVYIGVVLLLLVVGFPGWIYSIKSRKIRGDYRRWMRASAEQKAEALDALFVRAGDDLRLLRIITDESIRLKQFGALTRATEKLESLNAASDITKVREQTTVAPPVEQHPLQVVATIEQLRTEGMHTTADDRLERAIARYGELDELVALRR